LFLYSLVEKPLHQKGVVLNQKGFFLQLVAAWAGFTQFDDAVVFTRSEVLVVDIVKKPWSS
jgi:hypothetical protein